LESFETPTHWTGLSETATTFDFRASNICNPEAFDWLIRSEYDSMWWLRLPGASLASS